MNTAELTDLLIQQKHVGSVIKVSGAAVRAPGKSVPYPGKFWGSEQAGQSWNRKAPGGRETGRRAIPKPSCQ